MRILGVKFHDRRSAMDALDRVRSRFGIEDVAVAPLADGEPSAMLLAGSFDDAARADVRAFLTARGGQVVSDVDVRLAGLARGPAALP